MTAESFERRTRGSVEIDICYPCQAIWFDEYESAALAPAGIIELFRRIHAQRGVQRRPLSQSVHCPVCACRLQLTHDIEHTNRIVYYRCPECHGRLTSFIQFLREKNFVRSLSPGEVARLKPTLAQVHCSSCGGPIDLAGDPACKYCRAPIAILDADAVAKTLAELSDQQRHRIAPDAAVRVAKWVYGQRQGPVDLVIDSLGEFLSE